MPSKQTENYHLSQWEPEDQVLRTDFNADNLAIDEALTALAAADGAEAAARQALETSLSKKGNCSIGTFTYAGTGTYGSTGPTKINFPRKPAAFIVFSPAGLLFGRGSENQVVMLMGTVGSSYVYNVGLSVAWSGSTCSFYTADNNAQYQMNLSSTTYRVIAFYAES